MSAHWQAYGDQDRQLMWAILGVWAKSVSARSSQIERDIRTQFAPMVTGDMLSQGVRRQDHPVTLHATGWLIGEGLTRHEGTIPVLTFEAFGNHNSVENAAFRVALLSLVDGNLAAEGWRFEQAEVPEGIEEVPSHPFAHAQAIIGWDRVVDCLIHPPHSDGAICDGIAEVEDEVVKQERLRAKKETLVKHPAFPLGVKTLTGLALAVYVTLYGVPKARKIFGNVRDLQTAVGALSEDLLSLRLLN
jgi:hypothetical protein